MSKAIENLLAAQKFALSIRPKVGGFPYLAETLRQAGVTQYFCSLPSCQNVYLTGDGSVVNQGTPLVSGTVDVPKFDREALIRTLRANQAGENTFSEFLKDAWNAGVVNYEANLMQRTVTYRGVLGETYIEDYPAAEVNYVAQGSGV